jgi:2-dehydro-3-deoxyphosphogluconate aldolase/(4S)-4-hydroxy-2-oxoglutarate aldolase
MQKSVLTKIKDFKIIPVVKINDPNNAQQLGRSLIDGGLPCAEITFRTNDAEKAIAQLSKLENFTIGAGTVLSIDTVEIAIEAGAEFIVSPGLNPKVVSYCIENNITVIPGVCTPSDIEKALDFGLNILKFFPAQAFGGLTTLKAISAPYNSIKFIPTGGINAKNLYDYLNFSKVFACGGSWMVKEKFINSGSFDKITALTEEAVEIARMGKK